MKASIELLNSDATDVASTTRELSRWVALGTVQRGVTDSLAGEVRRAAEDVENETGNLTQLFQSLAQKAEAQSQRVTNLSSLAHTVEIEGTDISFTDVAELFEETLSAIVSKISREPRNR